MNNDAIDIKDVMERVQDDKELLLELLDIFEQDYREKRVLLDELIAKKNVDEIRDISHSIKGATGNISAKRMHECCAQIEKLAEAKDMDKVIALMPTLDEEFRQLKVHIEEIKKDYGKSS